MCKREIPSQATKLGVEDQSLVRQILIPEPVRDGAENLSKLRGCCLRMLFARELVSRIENFG